jgi:hypothetical protein
MKTVLIKTGIAAATNSVTATVNVGNLPKAFGQFIVYLPASEIKTNTTEQPVIEPTEHSNTSSVSVTNAASNGKNATTVDIHGEVKTPGFEAVSLLFALMIVFILRRN